MAKVLVVEDDVDLRGLVENRLRRHGHRVVSVGSGEEALAAIAEKGAPDVAVLDVLIPGMSGLVLLRTLRAAGVDVALLDASRQEHGGQVGSARGRALGASYLTKPLVVSALINAVESATAEPAAASATW